MSAVALAEFVYTLPALDPTDPDDHAKRLSAIRHEMRRRHRRAAASAEAPKVCPACDTTKTQADFNRNASRPDGLDWKCRACLSTARRAARSRAAAPTP